nr:reverse transcriptase domain-containing protein [Tanacetum cinerariifolium]
MPFGLKNDEATYQRLVDKAFKKQIGRNLEVYVDDLAIKTRTKKEVIRDIEETFKTLRKINMQLNPKKYAFGMREGTFLGYKVDVDGLRVCPDKIKAVLNLPSPKCLKDVQNLNGKLSSLNRFLSKSAEKSLPFFKTLKRPRTSVKGQILADFIVERPKDDHLDTLMDDKEELSDPWILFTDGSSCMDGSGTGLIITNPKGIEFTYALRFMFNSTNNEEKYEALIADAKQDGIYQLCPFKKASTCRGTQEKSIDEKEVLKIAKEEGSTMMTPIYEYLTEEILLEEKRKARVICRKAGRYVIANGTLYKKSFLGPWLRCVGPLQANYVLREIHEGSCSMHYGPRSIMEKALRSGYYWPTMHTDAKNLIRECSSCQGIDIVGLFPEGPGKVKFIIVAIDYFTKWIEANPVATITGAQIKKFMWDNIVCRFRLPGEIIPENGKQFRDNPFKYWCEKLSLGVNLNLLEEKREQTTIQEARSKAKMGKYYNARVRSISFHPGDLVYRNNEESHAEDGGTLGPKWDRMKSQKHWAKEHTSLETTMEIPFHEHGTSATLRNVIRMKCKHLSHARQSSG